MCRHIRHALLVLILGLSVVTLDAVKPKDVMGPVRAFTWTNYDMDQEDGTPKRDIHCTAFAVGPHQWVTAGHCIHGMQDYELGEDANGGWPVTVKLLDISRDLAGMVDYRDKPLKEWFVLGGEPKVDDQLATSGYPYGLVKVYLHGWVAMPSGMIEGFDHEMHRYMFFTGFAACPGQSGSPVVDKHSELVSVVQFGLGYPCSSLPGGAPYTALEDFLAAFRALPTVSIP